VRGEEKQETTKIKKIKKMRRNIKSMKGLKVIDPTSSDLVLWGGKNAPIKISLQQRNDIAPHCAPK
jgi:hypothetical protein